MKAYVDYVCCGGRYVEGRTYFFMDSKWEKIFILGSPGNIQSDNIFIFSPMSDLCPEVGNFFIPRVNWLGQLREWFGRSQLFGSDQIDKLVAENGGSLLMVTRRSSG